MKESEPRRYTRRGFLRLGTLGAAAVSIAPVFDLISRVYPDNNFPERQLREELARSGLQGFGHNASENQVMFARYLKSSVQNLEVDVQYSPSFKQLYVAHYKRERDFMVWKQAEKRDIKLILADIRLEKRNPHFDIKFPSDPKAIELFSLELNELPENLDVTISGHNWNLLGEIAQNPKVARTLFTVENAEELEKIAGFTKSVSLPSQTGVSLKNSLANEASLQALRKANLLVLVYNVNSPSRTLDLSKLGAWGITSDSIEILEALQPASPTKL